MTKTKEGRRRRKKAKVRENLKEREAHCARERETGCGRSHATRGRKGRRWLGSSSTRAEGLCQS